MEKINTPDIVDLLYDKCPFPRAAIKEVYDALMVALQEEIIEGNTVRLTGIGTFSVKEFHNTRKCPVAKGIGTYTGEMKRMDTKRRYLRFKPTPHLHKALNKENAHVC